MNIEANINTIETTELYKKNMEILQQYWPDIWVRVRDVESDLNCEYITSTPSKTLKINGIHISSCVDKVAEAKLQASAISELQISAWVYGIGTGDLPIQLLKRKNLEECHVVLLSIAVFRESLKYFDHTVWLTDPRATVTVSGLKRNLNESPSEQLKYNGTTGCVKEPFTVVPSCLLLADEDSKNKEAARLRDLLELELSSDFINKRFKKNGEYCDNIRNNYQNVKMANDVRKLFSTKNNSICHAVGAGPTLSDNYELLRNKNNKDIIIAVDAALIPLVSNGIVPDIVITVDGQREPILSFFGIEKDILKNIKVVFFPIVHPDVIELICKNKLYVSYSSSVIYKDIKKKYKRDELFASGSVIHPVIDLGIKMGAAEVRLYGVDFSFPGDYTHVKGAVNSEPVAEQNANKCIINGFDEKVPTLPNLRGYLRDLETFLEKHSDVKFVNMSRRGGSIGGAEYYDN